MNYQQLKEEKQKKFDDFAKENVYWIMAFSEADFIKELEERNLREEDLVSIGYGGFIKRESVDELNKLAKELDIWAEIKDNDDLLKDAFIYELGNHEYCITFDLTDTLDVFDLTFEEVKADKRIYRILKEAVKQYLSEAEY